MSRTFQVHVHTRTWPLHRTAASSGHGSNVPFAPLHEASPRSRPPPDPSTHTREAPSVSQKRATADFT